MADLAIYIADKKLLPPVADVLGELVLKYGITDIIGWDEFVPRDVPVLCLGAVPETLPLSYVKTLSQKQILSNPAALTELQAAMELLTSPPNWPTVPYAVVDGLTDEEERKLGPALVVDIETGGDFKALLPQEMWLLSVAIYDGKNCYVFTEESLNPDVVDNARDQLIRILKSRKLIAHNMKFDFRTLSAVLGVTIYGHLDTMLLHHAINPGAREHGLKQLAKKYLGAEEWEHRIKEFVKGKKGYEAIPREILYGYNALDVIWTWRLYEYMAVAAGSEERLLKLARREFSMGNFFQDVENNGCTIDIPYIKKLQADFYAQRAELLEELRDITWEDFNPNSPQQVKRWFAERGLPLKSTAEGVLEDLVKKGDLNPRIEQFIELLLEFRGVAKMIGTYTDGLLKRVHFENRVFPTFKVHGTNTGRLSSADPNIQNIPRDKALRKIFISKDEETRTILNVDYSQAELRVMACLSGDPNLQAAFAEGAEDFFDALMPVAFPHLKLSELTDQEKKDSRARLKGVIYGLGYGRGAKAIAKSLDMSVKDAQSIINNFFRAYPLLYDWRVWVSEVAIDPENTLVTKYGRYYQAEVVTGKNKQNVINSGLAFLPQSTASDLCVDAAIEVHKWIGEYDAFIWATVHDAIMIDVPKKHVEEVGKRVQWEMEQAGRRMFGDTVLFATDASHGRSWGDCN